MPDNEVNKEAGLEKDNKTKLATHYYLRILTKVY